MKDMSYIFHTYWLKVPDLLYLILLFGSWIMLIISVSMIIRGIVRKNEKRYFVKCVIVMLVALLISLLAMTGKIAPYMSFGG